MVEQLLKLPLDKLIEIFNENIDEAEQEYLLSLNHHLEPKL